MTTKQRPYLLVIFLTIMLSVRLQAQDKYEYAVIDYNPSYRRMEISINGNGYKKVEVEKSEIQGPSDVSVALKEIDKMSNEGWEIFTTNTVDGPNLHTKSFIFYLRRKAK